MFNIDLQKLKTVITKQLEFMNLVSTYINTCDISMRAFADNGFFGFAQVECLERFNTWINDLRGYVEQLIYMDTTLNIALSEANFLKQTGEDMSIALDGFSANSSLDTGEVYLSDNYTSVSTNCTYVEDDITGMIADSQNALSTAGSINYSSTQTTYLYNSVYDLKAELNNISTKIQDFASKFNEYVSAVTGFEERTASAMEYTTSKDFSLIDGLDMLEASLDFLEEFMGSKAINILVESGIKETVEMSVSGKYFNLSGYSAGDGVAPRYLISNLDKYPKLQQIVKSKAFGVVSDVAKVAGYALDAWQVVDASLEEYNRNPYLPKEAKMQHAIVEGIVETGEVVAVAVVGAAIGTAILPGVGTVAGAVIGAAIGIIAGAVGNAIMEDIKINDTSLDDVLEDGINSVINFGRNLFGSIFGSG